MQAIEFSIVLLVVQEECTGRMVHAECFRLAPADGRILILLDDDRLIRVDRGEPALEVAERVAGGIM